jgi:hypothetical protein
MNENNSNEVLTAFEMLLAAIEDEIDSINQVGARAQERRDYASANATIERANLVTDLSNKVVVLRKEWELFVAAPRSRQEKQISRAKRRNLGRIETGLCTPQTDYYHPILQALQDLGARQEQMMCLKK